MPKTKAKTEKAEPLFFVRAEQPTWLKKKPVEADSLPSDQKVQVKAGHEYGIAAVREIPRSAHVEVDLAAGGGTWFFWQPHWHGWNVAQQPSNAFAVEKIDWNNFTSLVTPHLTVGEVLQFDARRKPSWGNPDMERILATAEQFELIRRAWGSSLMVTSFYRPEPINTQVGGVRNSYHVTGQAMDIYPSARPLEEFYQWIRRRWTGGLGDGRNRGFIHLDTRWSQVLQGAGGFVPGAGRSPTAEWTY